MSGTGGFDELSDIPPAPGVAGMRAGEASFEQLLRSALGTSRAPEPPSQRTPLPPPLPPEPGYEPPPRSTPPPPARQEREAGPLSAEDFVVKVSRGHLTLREDGNDRFSLVSAEGTGVSGIPGLAAFRAAQAASTHDGEMLTRIFSEALIAMKARRLVSDEVIAPVMHLDRRPDRPTSWSPPIPGEPTPPFADVDLNRSSGLRRDCVAPIFPPRARPRSAHDKELCDTIVKMAAERGLPTPIRSNEDAVIEHPPPPAWKQKLLAAPPFSRTLARLPLDEWVWVAEELNGVDLLIPEIARCLDLALRGQQAARKKEQIGYEVTMRPNFMVDMDYLASLVGEGARAAAANARAARAEYEANAPMRAARQAAFAAERERRRAESEARQIRVAEQLAEIAAEGRRREAYHLQVQRDMRDQRRAAKHRAREQEEMLEKLKEANTKRIVIDNGENKGWF